MNAIKLVNSSLWRAASAAVLTAAGALLIGTGSAQAQPSAAAPTPVAPQGHVISIYNSSGTYTNVPVGDYYESWWQPGVDGLFAIPSTSSSVLSYVGMSCCAGIELNANTINISGCTNLHVDVYTPNGNNFAIKLVDGAGVASEIVFTPAGGVIAPNSWIGLNMPISQFASLAPTLNLQLIKQVGIIDGDGGGTTPADYYIDNIYFSGGTNLVYTPPPAIPAPTNNAPTPTQPAGNVVSVYNSSATYSDSPANEWPASWSGSAQNNFVITNTGSTVLNLPGLSYVGDTYYSNPINTAGLNTLHLDLWSANANQFFIQLVSLNGGTQAAQVGVTNFANNHWVGIDIPLSQFTAALPTVDLTAIQQILWVDNTGAGLQNASFYLDNVYFYSNVVAASTNVYLDPSQIWVGYMNVFDLPAKGGAYEFGGAWGTAALPAVFNAGVLTLSPNVNTYNATDSYWSNPDGSGNKNCDASFYVQNDALAGQVVTFSGYCQSNTLVAPYTSTVYIKDFAADYSSSTATNLALVSGTRFSVTLKTTAGDHIQYGFETIGPDANPATVASLGKVLVASNVVVTLPPPNYPTNNAPTPTRPAGNVLALYNSSGTYANATGINWYPWGAASSAADFQITGGNLVKSYLGLSYYGVELNPDYNGGADVDASAYSNLHVDVWTTANQLAIKLVSTLNGAAPELFLPASGGLVTSNHWVSLDLPLAAFTSLVPTLDLKHLSQLLWIDNADIAGSGVQGGNFYIDNVYFFNSPTPTSPKVIASLIAGARNLSFATQSGFTYTVQYKNNLSDATWTTLSAVSGTGSNATVTDSATGLAQRFYRVSIQ